MIEVNTLELLMCHGGTGDGLKMAYPYCWAWDASWLRDELGLR